MSNLNSLYTVGDTYKQTSFKYVNGFWISTVGILALAQKFPDSAVIHNYLSKPTPLSDDNITLNGDTMTDVIAGCKALYDNKTMNHTTWLKFMALFRELNSSGYKKLNDDKFIKLTKEMIQVNIRPHQIIQSTIFGYVGKKVKLEECIMPLFQFNEQYKLSQNFRKFCLLHRKDI